MATESKRRRSLSPPATALASSSSSSKNPLAVVSSSPYFPPELIPSIASRLTSLQDFFALRAACRTYRALLPPSPSNLASQPPHLLVPHKSDATFALLHLPLRRILRFRLPSIARQSGLTSLYPLGCRVAVVDHMGDQRCLELRIIHLLTGEVSRLPYPPKNFYRVLLSGDLVLACNPYHAVIQYCRLGDACWRVTSCGEAHRLEDLIFVKGILYVLVTPGYRLAVVEVSDNKSMEFTFLGGVLDSKDVPKVACFRLADCHGELLLICSVGYFQQVYQVFRWQSGEGKWARTTSLGGCTLFFAYYGFAGYLGPDHPGIRRDCVYSSFDTRKWSEYSLVDGSFDEFVATGDYGEPVWVFPSMC